MSDNLFQVTMNALDDLLPHAGTFDAIVCGGDHHGIAIAASIASAVNKPLMIVCMSRHACVVSHITCIGDTLPTMRFLYVDDWLQFGATKRFVLRCLRRSARQRAFTYFAQSGEPFKIVATYAATLREYRETA